MLLFVLTFTKFSVILDLVDLEGVTMSKATKKADSGPAYPDLVMFGERLKGLRNEKGWTQPKLCEKLETMDLFLAPATISAWEHAQRSPTLTDAMKIADLFGVSVDYLLGRVDSGPCEPSVFDALDTLKSVLSIFFAPRGYPVLRLNTHFLHYLRDKDAVLRTKTETGLSDETFGIVDDALRKKYENTLQKAKMDCVFRTVTWEAYDAVYDTLKRITEGRIDWPIEALQAAGDAFDKLALFAYAKDDPSEVR